MLKLERPGFLTLIHNLNRSYEVKSRRFYTELLKRVFNHGKNQVKKRLEEENCGTVAVQMDGWSAHHHGYIGVIVTFITKNWRRVVFSLSSCYWTFQFPSFVLTGTLVHWPSF